jgi:hypothetical protein
MLDSVIYSVLTFSHALISMSIKKDIPYVLERNWSK